MKNELKLAAILTLAVSIVGCASGGGSGPSGTSGFDSPPPGPSSQSNAAYSPCGTVNGHPVTCTPLRPEFPPEPEMNPLTCSLFADACPGFVPPAPPSPTVSEVRADVNYESGSIDNRIIWTSEYLSSGIQWKSGADYVTSLYQIGQSGIGLNYGVRDSANPPPPPNPFSSKGPGNIEVYSESWQLGWDYQSFGIWNDNLGASSGYGLINASSHGVASPASAVPLAGSATFLGKLAGLYVAPDGQGSIATANLAVNANFSSRSLSFATSGTSITRDIATATAAPNLNLSGTLSYAQGSSAFSGTLINAGSTLSGPSKGQFYGPAAQELGGVFTLKSATSVETLVGAYGAKR